MINHVTFKKTITLNVWSRWHLLPKEFGHSLFYSYNYFDADTP